MLKIANTGGTHLEKDGSASSFRRLKELGYDAVDYSCLSTEPGTGLYAMDDRTFEEFLLRDRAAAKEVGIEIVQAHGVWPYDDTKPEQWQLKLEATVKSIKGASIIGSPYIVLHPVMPSGWAKSPDFETHEAYVQENIDYLNKLIPYAKEYGVKIALENMPGGAVPCSTVPELIRVVDAVDSEYVGVCFDTGHSATSDGDVGRMVRLLGDRLKCLHIHDNDGCRDLHLTPYTGVINWQDFTDALREIGYQGAISLETNKYTTMPERLRDEYEHLLCRLAAHLAESVYR